MRYRLTVALVCVTALALSGCGGDSVSSPATGDAVLLHIGGTATSAAIVYLDATGRPVNLNNQALPWSLTLTMAPALASSETLQAAAAQGSIICRITINGEVSATNSAGVGAATCVAGR